MSKKGFAKNLGTESPQEKSYLPLITLRPLQEEDIRDCVRIESVSNAPAWQWDHFQQELAHPFVWAQIAERDERVAGFLIGRIHDNWAEVLELAVDPAQRRRGIARELLHRFLRQVQHLHHVTLEMRADNNAAQQLYESFGFQKCGEKKLYYSATHPTLRSTTAWTFIKNF